MARFNYNEPRWNSESIISIVALVLIIVVFAAIVAWPSSSSKSPVTTVLGPTALTQQLNDADTVDYLNVLHRVKPKQSAQLHAEAALALVDAT